MSNLQVAQYLLGLDSPQSDKGKGTSAAAAASRLPWCEGVVFLDEYDRKMILVRSTGRVLKLAQCGIPLEKRFAFYDQVHTTGMDIQHVLNAKVSHRFIAHKVPTEDYAQ
jgi:hypothetical protein